LSTAAPTYDESVGIVRARGIEVAKAILAERGEMYREAATLSDAQRIVEDDAERFLAESDLLAAGAALMQAAPHLDREAVRHHVEVLVKWGTDAFYDDHDTEGSLRSMQLAAGLDPMDEEAIKGVLSACLHGEPMRPHVALPYMVILARLNPRRNEVAYVLRLIDEQRR
jgi:hypothetical protein